MWCSLMSRNFVGKASAAPDLGGGQDHRLDPHGPPSGLQRRSERGERCRRRIVQEHDQVYIAPPRPVAPACEPPVQDQAGQIRARRACQLLA